MDFPIKNGDFPVRYVNVYQRVYTNDITSHASMRSRKPSSSGVSELKTKRLRDRLNNGARLKTLRLLQLPSGKHTKRVLMGFNGI